MLTPTTLPALLCDLHAEALMLAHGMRKLTLDRPAGSKTTTPQIADVSAASLVMRIVFIAECVAELQHEIARNGAEGGRRAATAHTMLMSEPFSTLGEMAPAAITAITARQARLERRYAWLCRALCDAPATHEAVAEPLAGTG